MAISYQVGTLDEYLSRICEQIQLTDTQSWTAVKRYQVVSRWLTETETHLDRLEPEIFPQGSMLQRTTIRPMRLGEGVVPFDIDTVCRCEVDPYARSSQSLYGSVQSRLLANEEFAERNREAREKLGTSGKCIRLAYTSDDFYLDVVPTCKDPGDPEGVRLLMCEPKRWHDHKKPIDTWRRTDPFRFAAWLQARCEIRGVVAETRIVASVAPVPPQEDVDAKAPLRLITQLLKRQRDIDFIADICRPTSILLTTLAGRHYRGEESIADGLETVLAGISNQINMAGSGRIVVPNPADEIAPHDGDVEDLAAPLDDAAYRKLCAMMGKMQKMLAEAKAARGVPNLYPILAGSFGDKVVKRAFNASENAVKAASKAGVLGAAGATGLHILTEPKVASGIQPVPSHNFHGSADGA
jgi:hypothetical protein